MKKLFFAMIAFLLICGVASAETYTFTWTPNTEPDLAGYRIYSIKHSGDYANRILLWEGIETIATVEITTKGNCYFFATAFDECGNESDPSNEVKKPKPNNPQNFTGN